jgi:hypothetical protein
MYLYSCHLLTHYRSLTEVHQSFSYVAVNRRASVEIIATSRRELLKNFSVACQSLTHTYLDQAIITALALLEYQQRLRLKSVVNILPGPVFTH